MGTYSDLLKSTPPSPRSTQQSGTVGNPKSVEVHPQNTLTEEKTPDNTEDRTNARYSERTVFRSDKRTVALPFKRKTKRYSFEFYEDQLTRLKRIKINAELSGESIALSEIVRTALDEYLQNKEA